jgi:catechol 2,3-dioxygenase-like lactoylglutathione lyase family enzyme
MIFGLKHLALAFQDLARGVDVYQRILKMTLHARWDGGACLSIGGL